MINVLIPLCAARLPLVQDGLTPALLTCNTYLPETFRKLSSTKEKHFL